MEFMLTLNESNLCRSWALEIFYRRFSIKRLMNLITNSRTLNHKSVAFPGNIFFRKIKFLLFVERDIVRPFFGIFFHVEILVCWDFVPVGIITCWDTGVGILTCWDYDCWDYEPLPLIDKFQNLSKNSYFIWLQKKLE